MNRRTLRSVILGTIIGLIICGIAADWRAEHFPANVDSELNMRAGAAKVIMEEPEPETKTQQVLAQGLGEFKLTAYCPCEKCCGEYANDRPVDDFGNILVLGSNGTLLEEGKSVAVDPSIIPYGTELVINDRVYVAQDCGGAIKGNRIDIYFESHEEALEFGVQYAEVWKILKWY